jgi:hypothetical protein
VPVWGVILSGSVMLLVSEVLLPVKVEMVA